MGSFDCYCALCSGPLGTCLQVGSSKPKHLRERRRRVALMIRRLKGEGVHEDSFTEVDDKGLTGVYINGGWEYIKPSEHKIRDWEIGAPLDKQNCEDVEMVDAVPEKSEQKESAINENGADSVQLSNVDDPWEVDEDVDDDEGEDSGEGGDDDSQVSDDDVVEDEEEHEGGEEAENDDSQANNGEEWEDASDEGDGSRSNQWFSYHGNDDESDDMFNYYEEHSYDPEKINKANIEWINRCRVLGISEGSDSGDDYDDDDDEDADNENTDNEDEADINENNNDRDNDNNREEQPDDRENNKAEPKMYAYISGRGSYGDYFDFHPGPLPVYHSYNPEEQGMPTYPFHEACYKILARYLGYESHTEIDQDVLYTVMQHNVGELERQLEVDYGGVEGAEQTWECLRGYEHEVADPGPKQNVAAVIQATLPAKLFSRQTTSTLDLSSKVKQDPLAKLPYDILYGITDSLPLKDTLSLVSASWHVYQSTQHPMFWKSMIRVHIVPYFYELKSLVESLIQANNFDWRGMFQWLDSITKWENAMESPFAGIANRRRIWNVCAQLAPLYFEKLNPKLYAEPSDEEAQAILSASKSYHTPLTLYPQPEPEVITKTSIQFIRSWNELLYRSCSLNTYWTDEYGYLCGISITFGGVERLFGSKAKHKGPSLNIEAGDWIQDIKITLKPISTRFSNEEKPRPADKSDPNTLSGSHIDSMTIYMKSGKSRNIHHNYSHTERALKTLPGLHIIGLTGGIAPDGAICRLGLLQASQPGQEPLTEPNYTITELMPWIREGAQQFCNLDNRYKVTGFHRHQLHTFPTPVPVSVDTNDKPDIPADVLPHVSFIWKEGPRSYDYLVRFTTFEYEGNILSISSTSNSLYGGHHKSVGEYFGIVPAMMPEVWAQAKSATAVYDWKGEKPAAEQFNKHFDFDGPGGERITEVHVSEDRKAFRLATNRGRVGAFGKEVLTKWDIFQAPEGRVIVGLTACFGEPQGWSESARMWSHFSLSDLCVITSKDMEE